MSACTDGNSDDDDDDGPPAAAADGRCGPPARAAPSSSRDAEEWTYAYAVLADRSLSCICLHHETCSTGPVVVVLPEDAEALRVRSSRLARSSTPSRMLLT